MERGKSLRIGRRWILTGSDQNSRCYFVALRLLTGRDYSCKGLQQKLHGKKFTRQEIAETVQRLMDAGYLDDHRYAERFVSSARSGGAFTGYRLRQELLKRGISPELADELLQGSPSDVDQELEQGLELVSRRYAGFDQGVVDDRLRRRVFGFLQRRGYGSRVIMQILEMAERSDRL